VLRARRSVVLLRTPGRCARALLARIDAGRIPAHRHPGAIMPPARALDTGVPLPAALEGEPPRIRFIALRASRTPSGRCRVEVELRRVDGTHVVGCADAEPSLLCDQRAAAQATVEALHLASTTAHRFESTGVKSVRAFDRTVVLAQVGVLAGRGPARLVGCAMEDGFLLRATALAVLNATDRLLRLADDAEGSAAGEALPLEELAQGAVGAGTTAR
jgi:hypothetical protein